MDILIRLDTRRAKKDGTFPIILRLSGGGHTLPISTGYGVTSAFWDTKKQEIKKHYTGYDRTSLAN